MRKFEEEHYKIENIKDHIYPWVKSELKDTLALNGKHFSEKDAPIVQFVGDLKVIFVIKRGTDTYEVLKDNMLAPDTDIEALFHTACENLVRDVEFVIGNTWYNAFAIIADGIHEASSLLFKHIWQVCVDKLQDDIIIMVPSKETVLFAPAGQPEVVSKMIEHGIRSYDVDGNEITKTLFVFSKTRKELSVYGS